MKKSKPAFDFKALEKHLLDGCKKAIAKFAKTVKKSDPLVFFAIDAQPYYGAYLPSFETQSNALACIKNIDASRNREWMDDPWQRTHIGARASAIPLFHGEVGDFEHHMFEDLEYDVSAFVGSARYKKLNAAAKVDGWIEGHARVVLVRVLDALVDGNVFKPLPLARPFGVGYAYHSEPLVICRVIA